MKETVIQTLSLLPENGSNLNSQLSSSSNLKNVKVKLMQNQMLFNQMLFNQLRLAGRAGRTGLDGLDGLDGRAGLEALDADALGGGTAEGV